ncbi:hypothetical protein PP633_01695 [Mycobacteroides abscessus]|nr:hypothetical protein [Mycobacteroides abscessus]MDM2653133.1 hypothetical protein [Mycobacteroides abscessus]MDM2661960.1 hypothetical protein [Mycobacteroides abscessus]MDM2667068.1 hypothetical protein [Mycobacteroides abscessus]MDM2671467.1 hypothetical protein [Mycobacteroides abscessus]
MSTPVLPSGAPFIPINAYLRAALAEIPDYGRLTALRAKLIDCQVALMPPAVPTPPHTADDDVEGWLTQVNEHGATHRAWQEQSDALRAQVQHANALLADIPAAHSETLLIHLGRELAALMTQTATVTKQLKGARTANEAVAKGVADSWQQLGPLRQSYDMLREAQSQLIARIADPTILGNGTSQYLVDELASDLMIANLDEVLPGWRAPQTGVIRMQGPGPDRRPWPANPIEQLVWLVVSDARPWILTMTELGKLWAARKALIDPTPPASRVVRVHDREPGSSYYAVHAPH